MQFFTTASFRYTAGVPYTENSNRRISGSGIPIWFARGTFHRARFVKLGPFIDPNGMFVVKEDECLIEWETKQPPPGTEQALREGERVVIQAILKVNRTFVQPRSIMHAQVDPDPVYAEGDWVAVWFGLISPAEVVGRWRGHATDLRDNSGSPVA
jgi:hypothetical protein